MKNKQIHACGLIISVFMLFGLSFCTHKVPEKERIIVNNIYFEEMFISPQSVLFLVKRENTIIPITRHGDIQILEPDSNHPNNTYTVTETGTKLYGIHTKIYIYKNSVSDINGGEENLGKFGKRQYSKVK